MTNLPAGVAAGLASLMTRQDASSTSSNMSAIIDSYIVSLVQAGFVPNAAPTTSKRDTLSLGPLISQRSVPSVPLVIELLGQHGFVPANGTTSKRDILDLSTALQKRTLPDINLVISRLAAHGFVRSADVSSSITTKRDATSDIDTTISQLEANGFNPSDFMQGGSAALAAAASGGGDLTATTGVTCPEDNGKTFSTGSDTYQVLCSEGYNGYDLTGDHTDNFPECLAACSAYVPAGSIVGLGPCAGASWLASFADANCFFKYNATTAGADSRVISGKKLS